MGAGVRGLAEGTVCCCGWLQQEPGKDRDGKYVGKELHLEGVAEGECVGGMG